MNAGTGLPDGSVAYVMLFNVLHAEDADSLLREALRVLRTNGTAPPDCGLLQRSSSSCMSTAHGMCLAQRTEQCEPSIPLGPAG